MYRCACSPAGHEPLSRVRQPDAVPGTTAVKYAFVTSRAAIVAGSPMQALIGFTWLLALQALGEALAHLLRLPFPGPVIGMLLLLGALTWPPVRAPVAMTAQFLLSHLSLLFIPVGVGVMTHMALVTEYGLRIAIVIVLSTWAGMAATLFALRRTNGSTHE